MSSLTRLAHAQVEHIAASVVMVVVELDAGNRDAH
jgi:hypothetical protein